jgi:hypothetical protein
MRTPLGLPILFRRTMTGRASSTSLGLVESMLMRCSLRCIQVIAGVLGRAGEEGQKQRLEAAKTGEVTWLPPPGLGSPFSEETERKAAAQKVVKKVQADEDQKDQSRGKSNLGGFHPDDL